MKYRHEKQTKEAIPQTGWQGIALWFIGFPGYIIFLLSWLGALVSAMVWLVARFIPPTQDTHQALVTYAGSSNGFVPGAALAVLVAVGSTLALAFGYWLSVRYTMKAIEKVAEFLETSILTVKLVGLPLGCGIGVVAGMLYRPSLGLNTAKIGLVLGVVGLCSFGLEYAIAHSLQQTTKTAS